MLWLSKKDRLTKREVEKPIERPSMWFTELDAIVELPGKIWMSELVSPDVCLNCTFQGLSCECVWELWERKMWRVSSLDFAPIFRFDRLICEPWLSKRIRPLNKQHRYWLRQMSGPIQPSISLLVLLVGNCLLSFGVWIEIMTQQN